MSLTMNDIDDLVTCSICIMEYNDEERLPKFLQCHHTLCLKCLKATFYRLYLMCPLCRCVTSCPRGPIYLKTNSFALHLLHSSKTLRKNPTRPLGCETSLVEGNSKKNTFPSASHRTDEQEWEKSLKHCKEAFFDAVKKWQEVQHYLRDILLTFEAVKAEIKGKVEEHDLRLTQLLLTAKNLEEIKCEQESSYAINKMIAMHLKASKEELRFVTNLLAEYEASKSIQIQIHFENDVKGKIPTCSTFDKGFRMTDFSSEMENAKELFLLWHLAIKVHKAICIPVNNQVESTNNFSNEMKANLERPLPTNCLEDSKFVLTFYSGRVVLGDVYIKPWNFHLFIDELAQFTKTPQSFNSLIKTANSKTFIKMEFINQKFRPKLQPYSARLDANDTLDVGLSRSNVVKGQIVSWEMIFLLRPFTSNNMEPSFLFGKVTSGLSVVSELSQRNGRLRNGITAVWSLSQS